MTQTQPTAATLTRNGTWFLTCKAAFQFKGREHDLILEWRRRDAIWDRECLGLTPTMVSSLHEFTIALAEDGTTVRAQGRIDPDPWSVIAGPCDLDLALDAPGSTHTEGTYRGSFNGRPIQGRIEARFEPAPPASRGVAHRPLEILDHFNRHGSAGRLYDFSHAGRGTCDPTAGLPVFDARDYGLRPDGGEEAIPAIQAALDAAGEAGGGVVQLPPGVLDCNVDQKPPPLRIRHDRVVLRGAGSGPDGTLLVNHRYSDTPEPTRPWRAGEHPLLIIAPQLDPDAETPPRAITAVTDGRRGGCEIEVADASAIAPGQTCLLRQLEVEDGSLGRDLVQGRTRLARNWQEAGKELVSQIAVVRAVEGRRVRLDAPLHRDVGRWPAQLCEFPMLRAGGIMNLRMRGMWGGYFIHHKNGEHDNGWDQVKFQRTCAGWAEDLVHENTTSALGLRDCLGCVVRRCHIMGNPGHNGFGITGRSTGNLFIACHSGRNMHGFNVQGTISGNAVVDCTMDEPSGIDLHGGIGCDNLFDSLTGGVNKGGGSANAVPPRHGPGMVLWNWCCGHYNPYKPWHRFAEAADHATMPGFIAVGVHGAYGHRIDCGGPDGPIATELRQPWAWIESPGQRVAPRSLHAWQCRHRDGT